MNLSGFKNNRNHCFANATIQAMRGICQLSYAIGIAEKGPVLGELGHLIHNDKRIYSADKLRQ